MEQKSVICPMCKKVVSEGNIARWTDLNSNKYNEIRFDGSGKPWCKTCTDKHDSIDWDNKAVKLVYLHANGEEEVLTQITTNHSMSVEDILNLTEFNLEEWAQENEYDYNALVVRV